MNVFFGSYALKHADDGFVSTSMFWTVQSSCGHGNGSINVDTGAGDVPNKGSGTVHLMLSMQDEEHIECLD